jgi:hypothetical protein
VVNRAVERAKVQTITPHDAVAVNLDAKIADSVQSVSKAPTDRRRKRRKPAV